MKLKVIAAIGLFFCCAFAGPEYKLVNEIPFQEAWMSTDKMGNIYVIAINRLLKFDPDGKPVSHYSQAGGGVLGSADCTDPLKLVLFYPDFGRIITLNNKLALESTVELRALGFVDPRLVSRSSNLGYWVYDFATFQLKKIDPSLKVVYESGDLQQLTGAALRPTQLTEADNFVYLNDPHQGILVFDVFGVYYKTIPVKNIQSLQVREQNLIYVRNNALYSYDQKRMEESVVEIPAHDSLLCARIEQNRLYLLSTKSLSIYSH